MDVLAHVIDPAMFAQQYMQNALLTGTIVALLSGLVGVFVVLRGVSFAAHSLAQMGFAGAAGVVLVGADPLWGLVAFAVGGAVGLGVLGTRAHGRDVTTALLLVAALPAGARAHPAASPASTVTPTACHARS